MNVKNLHWVSIVGRFNEKNGVLRYFPDIAIDGPNQGQPQICVAKSNLDFQNGIVKFRVRLEEPDAKVQVLLSHGHAEQVFAGLNCMGPYGIATFKNNKWENMVAVGGGSRVAVNRDLIVEVRVNGSNIELLVDGVSLVSGTYSILRSQLAFFFTSTQEATVELLSVEKTEAVAFVVMQFTDDFNALYKEVIQPTCSKYGFTAIRADDIYNNGLIIEDISRSIRESDIVIADITPDNPNVFYEVGFAHGIAKPTILLSDKKRASLPFDVHGFRTIFYDNTIGGKSTVESTLSKHLANILAR